MSKENELFQKAFTSRVKKDKEVYKKYIETLKLLHQISNFFKGLDSDMVSELLDELPDLARMPLFLLGHKDLDAKIATLDKDYFNVVKINFSLIHQIPQTMDYLQQEIIELDDEDKGIDGKMLRKYSLNAGVPTIAIPKMIEAEISRSARLHVSDWKKTKPGSEFNSPDMTIPKSARLPLNKLAPPIPRFEESEQKTKPESNVFK